MTEKEIKKMINDLELLPNEKETLENHINILENIFMNNNDTNFHFDEIFKTGSYSYGILIHDEKKIEIVIKMSCQVEFNEQIKQKLIMNYLNNDSFDITFNDDIQISVKVILDSNILEKELMRKSFIDEENRKYSYYKNVLKFIKYYANELKMQKLNDYTMASLLSYGLHKAVGNVHYSQYVQAFLSSLDDLLQEKKLNEHDNMLFTNQKYVVVDPIDENINLTSHLDEVSLTEIRNLKKRLQKLFEVAQEEILGSGQLILDVTPIYNEEKDCYAWNYKIVNTSYIANGGEFKNNPFEYKTAILRALFKGLKFIIDSEHIYTKTILIRGCDESILKCIEKNVDEQENNSRRKTIIRFIDDNKIKLVFTNK